MENLYSSDNL